MNSAIYEGFVRHRRHTPKQHTFSYQLFMFLIDLSEIDLLAEKYRFLGTSKFSWARFKRTDYLDADNLPLSTAVLQKMSSLCHKELSGEVYLLGNLRYLGIYFSPLNVYFLKRGDSFTYMLAEVSNTPWNETHYYLLDISDPQPHAKQFHVSPFNPMNQQYHWKINPPGENIGIHIESHQEELVFDATLNLKRRELNQTNLNNVLMHTPVQTLSVVTAIYWQAMKLFLKGVPYHQHPKKELQCPKNN